MHRTTAAFALLALLAQNANAASTHDTDLILPHPLRDGETAWIEVQTGPIARGEEIDVTTISGRELGTISPFTIRAGRYAGIYSLPLPEDAIRNGRISIRLAITQFGAAPRAPTAEEVRNVRLTVTNTPH